jgi:hypothetical protein
MTITSGQVITTPDVTIEQSFFLPPGLVNVTHKFEEQLGDDSPPDVVDDAGNVVVLDEPFNAIAEDGSYATVADISLPVESKLPVPGRPTVLSETVRVTPGGNVVIDVVLEVPDIVGVTEVDVRIGKVL